MWNGVTKHTSRKKDSIDKISFLTKTHFDSATHPSRNKQRRLEPDTSAGRGCN